MPVDLPIVDGFVYSVSLLYLSTTYRASVYAQMEILRRAAGYRVREYIVPDNLNDPIPAYDQVEQQVQVQPGAYLWGLTFNAPSALNPDVSNAATTIRVQITDACTETQLLSDYAFAFQFDAVQPGFSTGYNLRNPAMMTTPRLIGEPGLVNVELYNQSAFEANVQLILLMAEPSVPPNQMRALLVQAGFMPNVDATLMGTVGQ